MKCDVLVIGCGVVGSFIAYELAQTDLSVAVVDAKDPASGSTGAALGVMMGAISQQIEGDAAELRLKSLAQFKWILPQLEELIGRSLPVNYRGILKLLDPGESETWAETIAARQLVGYSLQRLSAADVTKLQPGLREDIEGGILSPDDRQIEPRVLTHALIQAARQQGVQFYFQDPVQQVKMGADRVHAVYTGRQTFAVGLVVIAAGLGSSGLGSLFNLRISMQSVKGQAIRLYTPLLSLGPVVTDHDRHLVPLSDGSLWVGATVEFAAEQQDPTLVGCQAMMADAVKICPGLKSAQVIDMWSGERPRPSGQRAPILGWSPIQANVILATGHYRNGVLLSAITAAIVKDLVLKGETELCRLEQFQLKVQPECSS